MDIPEKYHRGYVTVNLDTVYDNIKQLKSNCRPGTNIIAVVKADGYGHGAVPIARKIDGLVSAYAVATIEEAVNLRNHKIDKPIYIIGYTHISQFHRLIENECRCTIFDALSAKKLSKPFILKLLFNTFLRNSFCLSLLEISIHLLIYTISYVSPYCSCVSANLQNTLYVVPYSSVQQFPFILIVYKSSILFSSHFVITALNIANSPDSTFLQYFG